MVTPKSKIVLCSSTHYKKTIDDVRASCALETAKKAARYSLNLLVVDDTDVNFRNQLKELGATVFEEKVHGMGTCRRFILDKAGDIAGKDGVVIWLEAEKYNLVEFAEQLAEPILNGKADMVIPNRDQKLFEETYPKFQIQSESLAKLFVHDMGLDWDVFFGPVAVNNVALNEFLNYPNNLPKEFGMTVPDTWDATYLPWLIAMSKGCKTEFITVPYRHPSEQTKHESGNLEYDLKRIAQLELLGLMYKLWKIYQ